MMIKSFEELTIYESPDGGKTVYSRKSGETFGKLHHVDPAHLKEQEITTRWANLKEAVFMADSDPAMNDLIEKVEIYYRLKK